MRTKYFYVEIIVLHCIMSQMLFSSSPVKSPEHMQKGAHTLKCAWELASYAFNYLSVKTCSMWLSWLFFFFLSTAHLESLLRFPSLKTPLFIIRTEWCKAGVGLIKFWSRTLLLPRGKSFQTVHLKSNSRSV